MNPPPSLPGQTLRDAEHIRLLAIFHFIFAGLAVLGLGFLMLHYAIMNSVITNPEIIKNQKPGAPDITEFFSIFRWVYVAIGVLIVGGMLVNLMAGVGLLRRKWRTFTLVVAGLNCMQIPFGTALGVFTFIVLLRPSVRSLYERHAAGDGASRTPG